MYTQTPIIAGIVGGCGYSSYLELGIRCAQNFKHIAGLQCIQRATAVDIDPDIPLEVAEGGKIEKIITTTDLFFETNTKKYDAIFIDADHNFSSVKRDFENSLNILTDKGTIFLHDTDPFCKEFLQPDKCSNSYLMNDYLAKKANIMFITLPVHEEGITMVRKSTFRYLNFIDQVD